MDHKRLCAILLAAVLALYACVPGAAAVSQMRWEDERPPELASAALRQEALSVTAQPPATEAVSAQPQLALPCRAALLMSSDTGEIVYEMNAEEELAMASITKVMTVLLTFEALEAGKIRLEDEVPVSNHAFSMGGSQIWLEPGEHFTLHEMLKAICVSSANDAAVAVAEFVGGSEPAFVEMMNARAAELGMAHTCFKNACGLDEEGHYSTARDIAVMSLELMKYPAIFEYTKIWTDSLRGGATQLTNTNKMLRSYEGITGLKTGTTGRAGVCISATATRGGTGLIAVVLGSASSKERFAAATALLDYGFANYETAAVPEAEGLPTELPVRGGAEKSAAVGCALPEKLLVKKGESSTLRCELTLEQELQAPVAAGTTVGEVTLYKGENAVCSYPVVTQTAVEKMTFRLGMRRLAEALFRLSGD